MSDFLSREADILGSDFSSSLQGTTSVDDIDFDRAASAFPDINIDSGEFFSSPPPPIAAAGRATSNGFSFDDFDGPSFQQKDTQVKVTGDDDLDKFENEFPDIDPGQQRSAPQQPIYGGTFAPQPHPFSTPILTQTISEDEPQVIRDWREKQQEEIRARDEASKLRREETIDKAERAIEDFYENYSKKKERNIRDNKNSESEYLSELSASLSTGTTWERICTLVELQNSQSKTIARTGAGTTDLTRFKEVFLRLKREGNAAPGAGGY